MLVVSGSSCKHIAEDMAQILGCEHHSLEARRFPDSEGYFRVPESSIQKIRSSTVVLVSNTFPDTCIIETLMLLEAINDVKEGRLADIRGKGIDCEPTKSGLYLAIPYFGYSRQDKRFNQGEAISARSIGMLLSTKCDGITVLDLHAPEVLESLPTKVTFSSSMSEIAEYLQEEINPDFILSPDKGAIERASYVAKKIDCKFSYLEKTRIDAHNIVHKAKNLDVNGAVVTIVDDMISTGGTICRASEALREQGAKAVYAACSHGLFTGGAISKLDKYVDGVVASDSLKNPRSVVSSAFALCRGIEELIND
ncbi:MAG: hypothetical protein CMB56_004035 [Methanobacteriota archaeon]|nr:MAG: hypothetical protein CMB56_004035 [Euryarchaeota archaeon]